MQAPFDTQDERVPVFGSGRVANDCGLGIRRPGLCGFVSSPASTSNCSSLEQVGPRSFHYIQHYEPLIFFYAHIPFYYLDT